MALYEFDDRSKKLHTTAFQPLKQRQHKKNELIPLLINYSLKYVHFQTTSLRWNIRLQRLVGAPVIYNVDTTARRSQ